MRDHSIYEYVGTLAEDKLAQIEALAVVGAAATHSNLAIHKTFRPGFFEVIARLAHEVQRESEVLDRVAEMERELAASEEHAGG